MQSDLIEFIIQSLCTPGTTYTRKTTDVPIDHRFWIIAADEIPRWIIPQDPRRGLPVLSQWRPYGLLSRLKWQALLRLYRTGRLGDLPGVTGIGISGTRQLLRQEIPWSFHSAPSITMYIGTPGVTRKAVITLSGNDEGLPVAVMKVPLGIRASETIAQEADTLQRFRNNEHRVAPRLLYHNINKGWSLQEAINGRPVDQKLTDAHITLLKRIGYDEKGTTLADSSRHLQERLVSLIGLDPNERDLLERALHQIDDREPIVLSWIHGDFAPWNLKYVRSAELIALDWEFSEHEGPPGLDLIHYLCRVLKPKSDFSTAPEKYELAILKGMKDFGKMLFPISQSFLKQLWRYYVVWYQIVLHEHGIRDPHGNRLRDITRRWFGPTL